MLPQGAFELIINLKEQPRHTFNPAGRRPRQSYRGAWIFGAHAGHLVIDTASDSSMIGVHFRPGGAAPFLGLPADELADRVVELDALWGAGGRELRGALLEAAGPAAKFQVLARFLLGRFDRDVPAAPAVEAALPRALADPDAWRVESFVEATGISHKHFIKLFRDQVGMTPKRFCRIQRFQRVLRELGAGREIRWVDVAHAGGFYDQAHLIHEFEAFSGLSPAQFLHRRAGRDNFIPAG